MSDQISADLVVKAVAEGFDKMGTSITDLGNGYAALEKSTGKAGESLGKTTKEIDKSTTSTKKAGLSLTDLKSGFDMAKQAAKAFTDVFKKAFEIGKEGAAVIQTTDSFERLNDVLDITPGLLKRLQDASRGTISDFELMSSTTKLLQGSSLELGNALGEATPQLLEIAKAANKLNPSLGSTAFLYESISTGIKRGSSLILDNLGLIIKVGDANEAYAKQLGKSSDALTLEEQKMALLNAVLEQGSEMIQQAGGSTESMTDSFERLDASTKNLTDSLKAKLAPALIRAADGATILLTSNQKLKDIFIAHEKEVRETATSYVDYRNEMIRAADVAGKLNQRQVQQIEYYLAHGMSIDHLITKYGILSQAQWDLTQRTDEQIARQQYYNDLIRGTAEETEIAAEETDNYADGLEDSQKKVESAAAMQQKLADALAATAEAAADAAKEYQDLAEELSGDVEAADLAQKAIEGWDLALEDNKVTIEEYNEAVRDIKLKYELATDEGYNFADSVTNTNKILAAGVVPAHKAADAVKVMEQAALSGKDSYWQLVSALQTAGIISEQAAVQLLTDAGMMNTISLDGAIGQSGQLAANLTTIAGTPDHFEKTANFFTNNYVTTYTRTVALTSREQQYSFGEWSERARGGDVSAGMPYVVGEERPEVFVPQTDGFIYPSIGDYNRSVGSTSNSTTSNSTANSIQININGAQNPAAVWNELERKLKLKGIRI